MGCDRCSAGVAMGGADGADGMGVGDEYGLGRDDQVAPSRRKAHREAKASRAPRARAGGSAATVATIGRSLCHAESQSGSS